MKIALLTAIAALAHIGVYLLVHQADIITQEYNVNALWAALSLTFAYSFFATLKDTAENSNR